MKLIYSGMVFVFLALTSKTSDLMDVFLNEKPVLALITVTDSRGEVYVSKISKEVDTTYAHTVKIVKTLENHGLIDCKKSGRKKIIEPTDKGEKFASHFSDMMDSIEKTPQETVPESNIAEKLGD